LADEWKNLPSNHKVLHFQSDEHSGYRVLAHAFFGNDGMFTVLRFLLAAALTVPPPELDSDAAREIRKALITQSQRISHDSTEEKLTAPGYLQGVRTCAPATAVEVAMLCALFHVSLKHTDVTTNHLTDLVLMERASVSSRRLVDLAKSNGLLLTLAYEVRTVDVAASHGHFAFFDVAIHANLSKYRVEGWRVLPRYFADDTRPVDRSAEDIEVELKSLNLVANCLKDAAKYIRSMEDKPPTDPLSAEDLVRRMKTIDDTVKHIRETFEVEGKEWKGEYDDLVDKRDRLSREPINVALVGPAGSGKSAITSRLVQMVFKDADGTLAFPDAYKFSRLPLLVESITTAGAGTTLAIQFCHQERADFVVEAVPFSEADYLECPELRDGGELDAKSNDGEFDEKKMSVDSHIPTVTKSSLADLNIYIPNTATDVKHLKVTGPIPFLKALKIKTGVDVTLWDLPGSAASQMDPLMVARTERVAKDISCFLLPTKDRGAAEMNSFLKQFQKRLAVSSHELPPIGILLNNRTDPSTFDFKTLVNQARQHYILGLFAGLSTVSQELACIPVGSQRKRLLEHFWTGSVGQLFYAEEQNVYDCAQGMLEVVHTLVKLRTDLLAKHVLRESIPFSEFLRALLASVNNPSPRAISKANKVGLDQLFRAVDSIPDEEAAIRASEFKQSTAAELLPLPSRSKMTSVLTPRAENYLQQIYAATRAKVKAKFLFKLGYIHKKLNPFGKNGVPWSSFQDPAKVSKHAQVLLNFYQEDLIGVAYEDADGEEKDGSGQESSASVYTVEQQHDLYVKVLTERFDKLLDEKFTSQYSLITRTKIKSLVKAATPEIDKRAVRQSDVDTICDQVLKECAKKSQDVLQTCNTLLDGFAMSIKAAQRHHAAKKKQKGEAEGATVRGLAVSLSQNVNGFITSTKETLSDKPPKIVEGELLHAIRATVDAFDPQERIQDKVERKMKDLSEASDDRAKVEKQVQNYRAELLRKTDMLPQPGQFDPEKGNCIFDFTSSPDNVPLFSSLPTNRCSVVVERAEIKHPSSYSNLVEVADINDETKQYYHVRVAPGAMEALFRCLNPQPKPGNAKAENEAPDSLNVVPVFIPTKGRSDESIRQNNNAYANLLCHPFSQPSRPSLSSETAVVFAVVEEHELIHYVRSFGHHAHSSLVFVSTPGGTRGVAFARSMIVMVQQALRYLLQLHKEPSKPFDYYWMIDDDIKNAYVHNKLVPGLYMPCRLEDVLKFGQHTLQHEVSKVINHEQFEEAVKDFLDDDDDFSAIITNVRRELNPAEKKRISKPMATNSLATSLADKYLSNRKIETITTLVNEIMIGMAVPALEPLKVELVELLHKHCLLASTLEKMNFFQLAVTKLPSRYPRVEDYNLKQPFKSHRPKKFRTQCVLSYVPAMEGCSYLSPRSEQKDEVCLFSAKEVWNSQWKVQVVDRKEAEKKGLLGEDKLFCERMQQSGRGGFLLHAFALEYDVKQGGGCDQAYNQFKVSRS